MATTPRYACSMSREVLGEPFTTKGPAPCRVPLMAITATNRIPRVVIRCPNRNAAQKSGGRQRNSIGARLAAHVEPGSNAIPVASNRTTNRSPPSTTRVRVIRLGRRAHSRSRGATTTAPTASPSHQVLHTQKTPDQGDNPPRTSESEPTVAAMAVAPSPAKPKKVTSVELRRIDPTPPAKRATSVAPTTASSVLPPAIASEVKTVPAVVRLTRNAPARTEGQSHRP